VTNEDYFGALAVFANGSRGVFEASRAIVGPQSQMAFDVYGTEGALSWNFETMNELQLFRASDPQQGYTTVRASVRYMAAQRIEADGQTVPLFAGVFAIFGHLCSPYRRDLRKHPVIFAFPTTKEKDLREFEPGARSRHQDNSDCPSPCRVTRSGCLGKSIQAATAPPATRSPW
jgi:hypothetical protein